MDTITTNSISKRRASEPEASEAMALISSANSQQNRVPPPLPYLPSDYRPSPDSPRHFVATQHPLLFDALHNNSHNKRQRSRSIGYPLAIENTAAGASASGSVSGSSSSTTNNTLVNNREHFELVPYREWTVIARNNQKGQLVLYNQDSHLVTVQNYLPDHFAHLDPNTPIQMKSNEENYCPYCHQSLHNASSRPKPKRDEPDFMDRNYFRLLASSQTNTAANSPVQSRSSTFSTDAARPPPISAQNLNANAFNQGYYSKFFVEMNKLGKGFRGSVFLCEHMLDGVKLGKYAVKKVAIGNNHPWLVRMLREVHLLERLRHPNIVSYKHSWLEYNRLTPFGPEVPCLFILMECANGGNLEEYFERVSSSKPEKTSTNASAANMQQKRRMSSKELKRERIRKQYQAQESFEKEQDISAPITSVSRRLLTMTEIWSLFLDIVQGLAHLHQQNIVHRDLKPPNLLLQYDERSRNGHQRIPRVLISDFGECEDLDETRVDDNRTGATGTLEFMAPEHVKLDPRGRNTVDYSPKADMWSLGMVLYFLCYSRLPYSVIDDVEILRVEILDFRDVQFPTSRFDIYKNDPALYTEALNNPNITSDIPNELKLLIRMLLSIDPSKRPSCNEILTKLRSIRRDETASIFQDIPSEWNGSSTSNTAPSTSINRNPTATTIKSPSPLDDTIIVDANVIDPSSSSQQRPATKHRHSSSAMSTGRDGSASNDSNTLRKRQRLLGNVEVDEDTVMAENDEDVNDEEEMPDAAQETPRLLLGSPDLDESHPSTRWLSDHHSIQIIKIVTVVLKIASCSYSCSPYSAKPGALYPVIMFALLDFWSESSSPSFLLMVVHVVWIMSTTLLTGGLCEA
ncbi:Integral membrane protein SED5 [Mucor velutinosus]|uniref:non-specific serine/threonine protein kinase n=1 Tax=Mucor velutinosus TaxID=708070 RepID=A0AAN7D5P0_9FUNG|nr:Integral membrane protein SED5 [Mucor velutinosus]